MNCTILEVFRHDLYHECFTRAADALFDLADALLTDPTARSFVELSCAATFQRRWSSLYEALEDGQIDRRALLQLNVRMLPRRLIGSRLVLGLDTTSFLRPQAHTSPDRTLVYRSNLPKDATPVAPGWQFSTLVVLPEPVSSWMYTLSNQRISSESDATQIGVEQLSMLLSLLKPRQIRPLVVLDRRYSNQVWVRESAKLECDQLIRARADQVLYREAPPRTGKRGAPRKDGERFQGSTPSSHGQPDQDWSGSDAQGRPILVALWSGLHLRQARDVPIALVRIERPWARGHKRDPRVSWFWWLGQAWPPLSELPGLYARRYGQEHGYRFDKQDLLWTAPRVRSPEQIERWTDLVGSVRNQLVLARPYLTGERRPWERNERQDSPRQVRRVIGQLIGQLGTPARSPQPRGKSPGRAKGAQVARAERHEVVRKSPPKLKIKPKRC